MCECSNTKKDLVLMEIKNSAPIKDIVIKCNVSKSTIYYWLKKEKLIISNDKKKTISYLNYEKLKKESDRLRLELQIYKDLHCFVDASIRESVK